VADPEPLEVGEEEAEEDADESPLFVALAAPDGVAAALAVRLGDALPVAEEECDPVLLLEKVPTPDAEPLPVREGVAVGLPVSEGVPVTVPRPDGEAVADAVSVAVAVGGGKSRSAGTRRPETARATHE
jgi:hypothetical protein